MFRSWAGCMPDCLAKSVLPSSVSMTRSWATWRAKPRWTAASMSASMTRNTYVGPVPETAVAIATSFSSSTSIWAPSAPRRLAACSRCAVDVSGVAYQTVMPRPSWAGVLGMLRTTSRWPEVADQRLRRGAGEDADHELARLEPTSNLAPDPGEHLGLDPSRTTSAPAIAAAFAVDDRMPCVRASASRRSCRGWLATICSGVDELASEQAGDDRLGHDPGANRCDRAARQGGHGRAVCHGRPSAPIGGAPRRPSGARGQRGFAASTAARAASRSVNQVASICV